MPAARLPMRKIREVLRRRAAGQTVPVIDRASGGIRQAPIFVAVLGASKYTYAEVSWTQSLPDWIGSHERAFALLGGAPETLVPDNLKSGVVFTHRYEPELNRTCAEMAAHYGVAVHRGGPGGGSPPADRHDPAVSGSVGISSPRPTLSVFVWSEKAFPLSS